jgi:hypothetical protein
MNKPHLHPLKIFLFVAVITVYILLLFKGYLGAGFPYTHDGENHLARFANYKVAVREGQIPPRFAPNLVNRYGYPVFNYNYPLANILSLPFSFAKLNYEVTFKVLIFTALVGGFLGAIAWLKILDYSIEAKLFSLGLFATSPYLVQTVFFRGNIGEIFAISLLPWLLWGVEKVKQDGKKLCTLHYFFLIGIWTSFFLSHNVTVLFATPFVILYLIVRLAPDRKKLKTSFTHCVSGILLSLWFWLPAVVEKSAVVVGTASLSQGFSAHFPTFHQLLFSPLTFGYSFIGSVDSASFSLGVLQIIVLLIASLIILKKRSPLSLFLVGSVWLLFFTQLRISEPLWNILPVSHYIQFPWRLSLLFSVFILPLAAMTFSFAPKYLRVFLILFLVVQLIEVWRLHPVDTFHKPTLAYEQFSQSTSTENENLPRTFTYEHLADWKPEPVFVEGQGSITVQKWSGSQRTYSVQLQSPAIIAEPTMNFLGWQTTISMDKQHVQLVKYSDSKEIGGRIAYHLEPGSYVVNTEFTQWTWSRILGNAVSAVTALVLVVWWVLTKQRQRK